MARRRMCKKKEINKGREKNVMREREFVRELKARGDKA